MATNSNGIYNIYGYGVDTDTARHITFPEERRNWRKYIEATLKEHITNEADRTIETVNDNTDTKVEAAKTTIVNRVDTAETNIKAKVDNVNSYVVNTLKPEVDSIKSTVEDNKTALSGITNTVNNIWNKIRNWTL